MVVGGFRDHIKVMGMKANNTEDTAGFRKVSLKNTLQADDFPLSPQVMVLFGQVSECNEYVNRCNNIRYRKDLCKSSYHQWIIFVLSICGKGNFFHHGLFQSELFKRVCPLERLAG